MSVEGLQNYTYADKVLSGATDVENRDKITISSEVDRVYQNVKDHLELNLGDGNKIAIDKSGMKDTGKK